MYNVSDAFLDAMHDYVIQPTMRGFINDKRFYAEDILAESFRCVNQCADENEVKLGGVFIGEMKMTLLPTIAELYPRGNWYGKKIYVEFGLNVNGKEEFIPVPGGTHTIYEANWRENGLEIVAYDNMILLDKKYSGEISAGKPWDWLKYVSKKCAINLSNTELEVAQMPNGNRIVGINNTENIETYRDLVYYLSQVLGGFATIDRHGALRICQYGNTKIVVDTINSKQRFTGSSFSDYTTKFTGLSVVNVDEGTTSYYNTLPDDGLTMNLGQNPFLQLGTKEERDGIRRNILKALSGFSYTPFTTTVLGCCAYDLGDVIRFSEGIAKNSFSCVMFYDYGLRDFAFSGFGKNPALESAKSKSDKNISGLLNKTNAEVMSAKQLINISDVVIGEDWKSLGTINFAVSKKQTILLHAVAKANLIERGLVRFKYVLNSEEIDFIHEVDMSALDTATLFLPFAVEPNIYNRFTIYVQSDDAEGLINAMNFRGSILGTGIAVDEFDGTIVADDALSIRLKGKIQIPIREEFNKVSLDVPLSDAVSDTLAIPLRRKMQIGLREEMSMTLRELEYRIITSDGDYLVTTDDDYMKT